MSTLRINNIEAQSIPASPTIDEKVKVTNSSGDILVNIDGKTSGITTIGINTTDGNIKFDANSNVLITGILTATTLSGNFTPTSLEIGSNIKLGNAGVITATSFVGSGANLTSLPAQATIANNADNRIITGGSGVNLNGESRLTWDGSTLDLDNGNIGFKIGGNVNSAGRSDNTYKIARMVTPHYHNAEEPMAIVQVASDGTDNILSYGGSWNGANAATRHAFYTAANDATLTGTERLRILSGGAVVVAGTSAYSDGTFGEAKLQFNTKTGNHIGACSVADTNNSITHILFKNVQGAVGSVGTHDDDLIVLTGNNERLRITSDGDFGTNGVTPTTQSGRVFHLHAGAAQQRFHMTNNTTGVSATDGFEIIVEQGANCRIRNFEAGYMAFDTGGSNNEAFRINADGNIIIGSGGSWNYPKALNVQGSTGAILSLANYDTTTYAADTNTSIDMRINTGNTGNQTGSCEIRAFKENGTNGNNARGLSFYTASNGASPAKRMVIDSSGQVTKPYQYVFTVSTNGSSGFSKAAHWEKITGLAPDSSQCTGVSDGTNWSNSSQQFTAPVTGVYHFFVGGWANGNNTGQRYGYVFKHTNGNNYAYIGGGNYCITDSPMDGFSRTIKLSAGEWVELWGFSAITNVWGGGHRFFWGGYLLG